MRTLQIQKHVLTAAPQTTLTCIQGAEVAHCIVGAWTPTWVCPMRQWRNAKPCRRTIKLPNTPRSSSRAQGEKVFELNQDQISWSSLQPVWSETFVPPWIIETVCQHQQLLLLSTTSTSQSILNNPKSLLLKYTAGKAAEMYPGLVGVCSNLCCVNDAAGSGSEVRLQMLQYYITSLKIPCCPKNTRVKMTSKRALV